MRVSTAQMQLRGTTEMLERQSELSRTQMQLSTGKRILSPGDDPVGSTQILPLNEVISQNKQFKTNGESAQTRLILEDSTLGQVSNIIVRVSELAIKGNNDSRNATDRTIIAQEIRQLQASLMDLANTTDASGEYIFAGYNVTTAPITESPAGTFNYTGDQGQRNVQLGATQQVSVGNPGDAVFINVPYSGGGTQSIFQTIEDLATNFEANTQDTTSLTDINAALDNFLSVRATVGARLNTIDIQSLVSDELIIQSQTTLSSIEDLDYAEAISRMNLQLVALQASQQTFSRVQNLSLFNYL